MTENYTAARAETILRLQDDAHRSEQNNPEYALALLEIALALAEKRSCLRAAEKAAHCLNAQVDDIINRYRLWSFCAEG